MKAAWLGQGYAGASVGYSGALEGASLYTSHLAQSVWLNLALRKWISLAATWCVISDGPHMQRKEEK
jgi:hypothetical protein